MSRLSIENVKALPLDLLRMKDIKNVLLLGIEQS